MTTSLDTGILHGIEKAAAYGPHVDAAVRELRARGHDRVAEALLASASSPARSFRETQAVARMARAPGTPAVVLKGVAQAIGDKPGMWDELAMKANPARQRELAGYVTALVRGNLTPVSPSAAHRLWKPSPPATAASKAAVKPGLSGKAKLGLAAALALAGYGAYRATAPKRYDNDRV